MNNAQWRKLLAEGQLCYICTTREPLPGVDEFGGHSCQQCRRDLASMRRTIALENGYQVQSEKVQS